MYKKTAYQYWRELMDNENWPASEFVVSGYSAANCHAYIDSYHRKSNFWRSLTRKYQIKY